ncbi:hypothetical protein CYY_008403 [Polysphondylium violaceum]|uniref:Uncharacterized protein n=1 Tax=Polysphondylium violaceum TaxID=133409 RepID=A0A8J4PN43_9MYCE|nr:hypothetical protein CYY_008403 [Polysphondylium violaceum]
MKIVNVNEPPRFGLESRKRNKDVNTRKQKQLVKAEKLKKVASEIKKNPNTPINNHTLNILNSNNMNNINKNNNNSNIEKEAPQAGKPNLRNNKPFLIYGEDKDKNALFPSENDIDTEDSVYETSISVRYSSNGFQHELRNVTQEGSDLQKAIQASLNQEDAVILKNPHNEIEDDFVIFSPPKEEEKDLESWELVDECTPSSLVNLISTPYMNETDFPSLIKSQCKSIKKDETNPWNQSKTLLSCITQQS